MGEDEPFGLNGRLRPRKSSSFSPQTKAKSKPEGKIVQDKPKRTSTPSKASPHKQDDFNSKSHLSSTPQFLCPYCDKKFASKQTVSKHSRRMHFSSLKQDTFLECLFCNHSDADSSIIRHMVDSHPNQYFACLDCHTRFSSTSELAEHKLNVCEKQKLPCRPKLRQKLSRGAKKPKKSNNIAEKEDLKKDDKDFQDNHGYNGIVISCEIKPSQVHDGADIEENITTNLILPPSKSLGSSGALEKNAVIVLDDIQQWNKRVPQNFSFHNTDADQILSRLGVVQRSTRTESNRRDWLKAIDDSTQKFEKCFDTKFYSKVASNVQENLTKFLDGSFNFNPDPDSTIKTRKSKNSVVINTAEGFPILLACEQYTRSACDSYLPRAIAPKHKWKWDSLENEKSLDQIKRDSHANNCIITFVSSLDIWTQLSMRQKYENKFNTQPLTKKTEKQNILSKELKEILESREIPTTSDVVRYGKKGALSSEAPEFAASLGLTRATPSHEVQPAVLSGEWVRPRCYVCCACGEQTTDSKGLSSHISTQHPNAHVQYYEIVGEPLLNADILKHLYVPPSQVCNRTRPPRGFRECTKCRKSITLEDLHQHMVDCAGDTPAVRRRQCRYRPFGVRRRRPRLSDNTVRNKLRKDVIRSHQRRQKSHMRPRPRIRTEVGDAETIRKMLADLPAKRHRVLVNPVNMIQRPRRKLDKQRSKLIMKKSSLEDKKNRKNRLNKGVSSEGRSQSSKSSQFDDANKNLSSLEDDEDNKPLKPKLKTIVRRTTRQRESLNRQTMTNRAKRKSLRVEQRKTIDDLSKEGSSSVSALEGASVEDKPQRIDVKRGLYRSREHANRGASNSRDEQRAGYSGGSGGGGGGDGGGGGGGGGGDGGDGGAGTGRHSAAPTQHAPLKHSIARLTADSETHDKSVQFHHLFLVQQECNNTNQHVPSGQHALFENEAVVTRLDKPPLHFCQKSMLDANFQKNKLNKPRKGLNDCIAMLKNKLVDPVPYDVPGHVSVQCGNDDPIEPEPQPKIETATKRNDTMNAGLLTSSGHNVPTQSCVKKSNQRPPVLPETRQEVLPKLDHRSVDNTTLEHTQNVTYVAKEITENKTIQVSTVSNRNTNSSSPKVVQTMFTDSSCKKKSSSQDLSLPTSNIDNPKKFKTFEIHKDDENRKTNHKPTIDESKGFWQKSLEGAMPNTYQECVIAKHVAIVPPESELHSQVPVDVYTDGKHIDIPADIPPAHASTHVESIVSAPLDLSSKMDSSNKKIMPEIDYDYETLDLSNKYSGQKVIQSIAIEQDVVDLRVKPSQPRSPPATLDLCMKSTVHNTNVSDIKLKSQNIDNFPTDLSVRGKEPSISHGMSDKITEESVVHDFSVLNITLLEDDQTNKAKENPTDLSGKVQNSYINVSIAGAQQKDSGVKVSKVGTDSGKSSQPVPDDHHHRMPPSKEVGWSDDTSAKNIGETVHTNISEIVDQSFKSVTEHRKITEKHVSKPLSTRNVDRSLHAPKPVYDPTLRIPQYKIRVAAEAIKSPVTGDSTEITTNRMNMAATCGTLRSPQDSSLKPGLGNRDDLIPQTSTIESAVGSHVIESTTPVYTLANTCIIVTKIESSNTASLTNAILSIPGSTIASTAPVYTLTGTIAAPNIYANSPDCEFHNGSIISENYMPSASKEPDFVLKSDKGSAHKCLEVIENDTTVEQDPETAKKIAMLPKELVEILGNMPVDHRNQLLNVLPQYVSPSIITSNSKIHSAKMPMSPEPEEVVVPHSINTAPIREYASNKLTSTPVLPSSSSQGVPQQAAGLLAINKSQLDLSLSAPGISTVDKNQEYNSSSIIELKNLKEELDNIDAPKHSVGATMSRMNESEYVSTHERIIDLTKDETVPPNINLAKIEVPPSITFTHQEKTSVTHSGGHKQKCNNDKTASLRAVRIKAPSERQKESQMLKRVSIEQPATHNAPELDENEVNKIEETKKSLAIQQAEVSSTQQPNKTTSVNTKYSAEGLSLDMEPCSEEANIKSHRISTPSEIVPEKSALASENVSSKSILVTSSISANNKKTNNVKEITEGVTQNISETQNNANQFFEKESIEITTLENLSDKPTTGTVPEDLKDLSEIRTMEVTTKDSALPTVASVEDDSEDDIILAAIVKQKQDEPNSGKKPTEVMSRTNSNTTTKKKKKGKRLRKTESIAKNAEANEEPSFKCTKEIKVAKVEITHINPETIGINPSFDSDIKNINNKNREDMHAEKPNKHKTFQSKKHNELNNEIHSESLPPCDVEIKPNQADTELPKLKSDVVISMPEKHKNICTEHVLPTVDPYVNSAEVLPALTSSISKPIKNNKVKEKSKRKRNQVEQDTEERYLFPNKGTLENLDTTTSQFSSNVNQEQSRKSPITVTDLEDISKKNSIYDSETIVLESNDDKKDIKLTRPKKMPTKELKFTNDNDKDESRDNLLIRPEISEDGISPLRRSRRGKSLYAETRFLDQDLSNPDITVDHKTPLTKKQLIFSKLLLDEENPLHSKGLEKDLTEITISDKSTKTDLMTDSNASKEVEAMPEKSKSIKRKKSLQTKRKNKKKKSVDSSECIDDSTLDDDSHSNNKTTQETAQDNKNIKIEASDNIDSKIDNQNNDLSNKNFMVKTRNDAESGNKYDDSTSEKESHVNQLKSSSSEKRKISNTVTMSDFSNSSKPKKTKLEIIQNDKLDESPSCSSSDTRATTCYNAPVAARRTRSKSVVLKSSSEMYDPYDIDLEDMIDTSEPLRRSTSRAINYKAKKKSSKVNHHKLRKIKQQVNADVINIDMDKGRNNSTPVTLNETIKESKEITDSKYEAEIRTKFSNDVTSIDDKTKSININEDPAEDIYTHSICKGTLSDSDDSSKSDVPLKKYVEEKNKLSELNSESEIKYKTTKTEQSLEKQNNNKYDINKQDTNDVNVSNISDEQLRSEQFMESFGFFSERKPRKSNLLATKKISETFHIISDESDDVYFRTKDRGTKKILPIESKKSDEDNEHASSKKNLKRGRKKKSCTKTTTCYCGICKKEFRRPDNYLRHQMTLLHVAKLSEVEMKFKTEALIEEPNYLVAYKQHIDRLRMLSSKLPKRKKNSKTKAMLPTLEQILADVNKTVREQQISRGLSRDEALFLDCCELLKESHKNDLPNTEGPRIADLSTFEHAAQSSSADLHFIGKQDDKNDTKSDGDVDSITAKTILESEEVRNLENDLISGLKEAANASSKNINYSQTCPMAIGSQETNSDNFSNLNFIEPHGEQMDVTDIDFDVVTEPDHVKNKKNMEVKDKMYPDIEEIDMFEDKFDKIKRKCRSQAAAAKQAQTVVKPISGHKGRRKSDKKKGKKNSKKNYQNTVLTKGALKGFDGIKVSIPTSDINMSAIVTPHDSSAKKKKKMSSKKKREKIDSETSSKYDSDHRFRDSTSQKKVDVYEFMDNEDAELFEFRPSTLMERFKSISNKDTPGTSKNDSVADEVDNSSDSASDGDDFVYMSDDYVCSDDETENSLLSCELGAAKTDVKKVSPLKRKDVVEKNAVMGKIFKHNAVRTEKKTKSKDTVKPKANLDQLFDSLLEEEPNSSMLNNDSNLSKPEDLDTNLSLSQDTVNDYKERKLYNRTSPIKDNDIAAKRLSPERLNVTISSSPVNKKDLSKKYEYGLSSSKMVETEIDVFGPSTSKKYDVIFDKNCKTTSPKKFEKHSTPIEQSDSTQKTVKENLEESYECNVEFDDDSGVARQRARRKCTVGKQNVLSETWSSESEPDGLPPRPNSAESGVAGVGRKKKGRKRESQPSSGRRGKVVFKKQDVESRVNSSNRSMSSSGATNVSVSGSRAASGVKEISGAESPVAMSPIEMCPPPVAGSTAGPQGTGGGGGSRVRPRPAAYFWATEPDDEQEHIQQHGWIVGDSHKKLVTMLAHAKGRKRNNDDKKSMME